MWKITAKEGNDNKKNKGFFIFIIAIIGIFALVFIGFIGLMIVVGLSSDGIGSGNIALIDISGIITTQGTSSVFGMQLSSGDIVDLIEKADDDRSIRAIIFTINSGGGSPVATDEIAQAIKKTNKTTVAVIRDAGASGAYWIASASDKIFANRMSLVGSIGVTSAGLGFEDFIAEYNVSYRRLVAGEYKDIGTPFREMTDKEKDFLQNELDILHDVFIEEISENRGMAREDVEELANGLFWTGIEAKDLGLIDEFGGKDEAVAYIEELHDFKGKTVKFRKELTFAEALMGALNDFSYTFGQGFGSNMFDYERSASRIMFV